MLKRQRANSRYLSTLNNCEENSVEILGMYSFLHPPFIEHFFYIV